MKYLQLKILNGVTFASFLTFRKNEKTIDFHSGAKIAIGEAGAQGNLSAPIHRAWGSLLRSHAIWAACIEKRLGEMGALSLEAYDVLLILSYAPQGRLKMGELYDAVTLSRSGLTRLVDRLERDGFVRREVCPNDRRSFEAILTDEGEAERARCWPIYAEIVAEEFGRFFSDKDALQLAGLLERPFKHESAGKE